MIVNLVLMSIFAIQHSVMAHPRFKQWWTKFVPPYGDAGALAQVGLMEVFGLRWPRHRRDVRAMSASAARQTAMIE